MSIGEKFSSFQELGTLYLADDFCSYFPSEQRTTKTIFAFPRFLDAASFEKAMHMGMRRSGNCVYAPICEKCRQCLPIRVRVKDFVLSKSQKNIVKKCENQFNISLQKPSVDEEHLQLYRLYQNFQHPNSGQSTTIQDYTNFLVQTITDTWELSWRDKDKNLIAVGIIDITENGISTVYFYWHPNYKNFSLGIFSILMEIELCKTLHKQYYYLGYLIATAKTMSYKAQFHASEIWNGKDWTPLQSRNLTDQNLLNQISDIEQTILSAENTLTHSQKTH